MASLISKAASLAAPYESAAQSELSKIVAALTASQSVAARDLVLPTPVIGGLEPEITSLEAGIVSALESAAAPAATKAPKAPFQVLPPYFNYTVAPAVSSIVAEATSLAGSIESKAESVASSLAAEKTAVAGNITSVQGSIIAEATSLAGAAVSADASIASSIFAEATSIAGAANSADASIASSLIAEATSIVGAAVSSAEAVATSIIGNVTHV